MGRKQEKGIGKRRATITLRIGAEYADRLLFLARMTGASDLERITEKAIEYFDRAVCAALDGGKLTAKHKSGRTEDFSPCSAT